MAKKKKTVRSGVLKKALAAFLVLCIIVAVLELTNTTHIFHKKAVPATIPSTPSSSSNKQSTSQGSNSNSSPNPSSQPTMPPSNKIPPPPSPGSSVNLAQPYGTFVSNHFPGQNGASTQEQSTCDTTPGASCYILFTNTSSGKTTKLPVQTVGADGSTIWNWNANTLTSGSWQAKAVASLGSQTKSATDTMELQVQ